MLSLLSLPEMTESSRMGLPRRNISSISRDRYIFSGPIVLIITLGPSKIYSSTVPKYSFEVLLLYLSVYIFLSFCK